MGYKCFYREVLLWLTLLVATLVACQAQPTITTTQLPYAQLNLPYNATFNATGGALPYTWTLVAGALPTGLSLSPSGAVSGTPTGSSNGFTVQVTDANFPQSTPAQGTFFIGFCGATVDPLSQGHTFEDAGGSDVLNVNSPCDPLTAGASVPWINVTGTFVGDGFDRVNIAVAPNATPAARTGNVTVTFNQVSPVLVLSYTITQYAQLLFSTSSPLPTGEVGAPYSAILQATGGSGINRSFAIASGSPPPGLGFSGQTISGMPSSPGTSTFTAQVTDHDGFSGTPFSTTRNFALTIVPPVAITPNPLPAAVVGQFYSATLAATGGLTPYSWSLASGALPAGLLLNAAIGVISGTPAVNAQGSYSFTARVADSLGPVSTAPFGLLVNPAPLVITSTVLPGAIVGRSYTASLAATGGVTPYSWSVSSGALPSGLFLNPVTGALSGTPPVNAQGSYAFTVRLADSVGVVATAPLQLLVDPPPLVIQNLALVPATEGVAYDAAFTASGGTPAYSWSASGLPSWLTLTSAGQLSGTPPLGSAGSYTFTIGAQDSASRATGVSFTLLVKTGPLLITTNSSLPSAKEGAQVKVAFQAGGGAGPYLWTGTALPPFLNLSAAGLLSGTAPAASAGAYSFSVTVADATGDRASGTFSLSIDPALAVTTSSALQATEGQAFSAAFTASGGTSPYSFSASGLPGWAGMAPGGALTGTPSRGSPGASAFSVVVTDAAGYTGSAHFTLTVLARNGGLTITTPSPLAIAGVGNYYQAALGAIGGAAPYRWSSSGVPDGLTLSSDGLLSGTPTTGGSVTVTAQVTDSAGNVAFQALGLSVTPAKLRIVTPSPLAAAEVSVAYSTAFQSDGGARPLAWSASGPLPAGMLFDSAGLLSGVPTAPGDFVFTVQVTDSTGSSASGSYEVLAKPFGPDLLASAGSLSFAGIRASAPSPVQTVSIISSSHDSVAFSASADAAWITAAASGTTPGRIDVGVDQTGLAAGSYSGTITVASPNRAPLFIKVGLTVKEAPPILQTSPQSLDFFGDGAASSPSQNIYIRNVGQGSLGFTVTTDVPWLSVTPSSGMVSPTAGAILIAAFASSRRLAPGAYSGTVEIDSVNGAARIPVTLLVSTKPKLILSDTGVLVRSRQGNGVSGPTPKSFTVSSSNGSPISFATEQIDGQDWLQLLDGAPAGTVLFTTQSAALAKGAYYARIRVTSPDVFNSPQDFVVVLNVTDAASPPVPDPVPSGLVFTSSGNQNVTVYTSSDQPALYQVAVSTQNGAGWLSASPLSGTVSTTAPIQLQISANGASLKPGIYTGAVHISISNLSVRTVNVTYIVSGSASPAGAIDALVAAPQAACTPANLVVIPNSLAGNFSAPAAWPQSVAVQLADDCGNPVTSGRVVAEFSNGDAPLSLSLSDAKSAVYSTTWTPSHVSTQLSVTARATASGLQPASTQIVGAVSENVAPVLARNGTLHNLYPQPGAPLAPGTIVQIFGSGMAAAAGITGIPLPLAFNGVSVLVGGELAPLYFVSSGQINAQIPVDLVPGQEYQVLVSANNAFTIPDTIHIASATPGIARLANGQVIAQHSDFTLVSEDAPARPGEFLVAYLAGMGLTDTPVGTGAQAPASPLAKVNVSASVAIDGQPAPVLFAGLTPGFIGLYQINFQVPAGIQSGDRKLEIVQSGLAANTSVLPVQ